MGTSSSREYIKCFKHKSNIVYYCLNEKCQQGDRFLCPKCLTQSEIHQNHLSQLIEIEDFAEDKENVLSQFDLNNNQLLSQHKAKCYQIIHTIQELQSLLNIMQTDLKQQLLYYQNKLNSSSHEQYKQKKDDLLKKKRNLITQASQHFQTQSFDDEFFQEQEVFLKQYGDLFCTPLNDIEKDENSRTKQKSDATFYTELLLSIQECMKYYSSINPSQQLKNTFSYQNPHEKSDKILELLDDSINQVRILSFEPPQDMMIDQMMHIKDQNRIVLTSKQNNLVQVWEKQGNCMRQSQQFVINNIQDLDFSSMKFDPLMLVFAQEGKKQIKIIQNPFMIDDLDLNSDKTNNCTVIELKEQVERVLFYKKSQKFIWSSKKAIQIFEYCQRSKLWQQSFTHEFHPSLEINDIQMNNSEQVTYISFKNKNELLILLKVSIDYQVIYRSILDFDEVKLCLFQDSSNQIILYQPKFEYFVVCNFSIQEKKFINQIKVQSVDRNQILNKMIFCQDYLIASTTDKKLLIFDKKQNFQQTSIFENHEEVLEMIVDTNDNLLYTKGKTNKIRIIFTK